MEYNYLEAAAIIFSLTIVRYALVTGAAYYYFWIKHKQKYMAQKIQPQPFINARMRREFLNSLMTSVIVALMFALPWLEVLKPYNKTYVNAADLGYAWVAGSVILLILIQDTYFYWMHRAIHHPKLFKWIHKEHHESRDPSPFAAYSFQPSEAVLEMIWVLPLMLLIPLSHMSLALFGLVSLIYNVNGHLGVDLISKHMAKYPALKWLNTTTLHNHHHKYFKGNYAFYFSFWDRIMKTEIKFPKKNESEKAA
jgi:Delta7-sterol 5-desaturase